MSTSNHLLIYSARPHPYEHIHPELCLLDLHTLQGFSQLHHSFAFQEASQTSLLYSPSNEFLSHMLAEPYPFFPKRNFLLFQNLCPLLPKPEWSWNSSVRLEYDIVKAELNSKRAELNNTVQIYQQFVDSNIALKKRENELRQTIDELAAKKTELQKSKLNEPLLEFHENNGNKDVSLEVQQEDHVISINGISIPQPNVSVISSTILAEEKEEA